MVSLFSLSESAASGSLRITVLAGGIGPEREVSLESGRAVGAALERLGHVVTVRDASPEDLAALDVEANFVFIALHGRFGEDGTVQRLLEERGVPYGGSGVEASKRAFDKTQAKKLFLQNGIPTPDHESADRTNWEAIAESFALPCVIKPAASGSSVDTFIARDRVTLRRRLKEVVSRNDATLVEHYIQGPELTVGILGEQALPVCQIRTPREFYDYSAKYLENTTEYLFDIDLPQEILENVKRLALQAHHALGCEIFSRVDCMVDAKTLSPFFLEVNTIPGFTSHSLLPKAAGRVGMSFDHVCQRIVELSMKRHPPSPSDSGRDHR